MDKYIINHINETTKPEDTLYILGDVAMNKKYALSLPNEVHCALRLISGNHDETFPRHKKAGKFINLFLEAGWKNVALYDELVLKDGTNVLMSHLPYANEETKKYDSRYLEWRPKDEGRILLCGHVHSSFKKLGRVINVGLDANNLKLLSEEEVIAIINDKRPFIAANEKN